MGSGSRTLPEEQSTRIAVVDREILPGFERFDRTLVTPAPSLAAKPAPIDAIGVSASRFTASSRSEAKLPIPPPIARTSCAATWLSSCRCVVETQNGIASPLRYGRPLQGG